MYGFLNPPMEMPPDTPIRGKKGEIWGLEVTDIYNWFKAPI